MSWTTRAARVAGLAHKTFIGPNRRTWVFVLGVSILAHTVAIITATSAMRSYTTNQSIALAPVTLVVRLVPQPGPEHEHEPADAPHDQETVQAETQTSLTPNSMRSAPGPSTNAADARSSHAMVFAPPRHQSEREGVALALKALNCRQHTYDRPPECEDVAGQMASSRPKRDLLAKPSLYSPKWAQYEGPPIPGPEILGLRDRNCPSLGGAAEGLMMNSTDPLFQGVHGGVGQIKRNKKYKECH